jgi:CubicO group peptidase (beta-lactamase class C family)
VDEERRAKIVALLPQIETIFRDWIKDAGVPGAALAVVVDRDVVYAKGFGVRDVSTNAAADAESIFRIASMTKSFTALAILKLRDEGKLGLDDPVARYVPELAHLAYPTRDAPLITVRHLLSHGAGFPEDNPWGDRQLALPHDAFGALLAGGLSFSHTPGTDYEYSNLGFMILGRVVARVAGMPYAEYVTREILAPLGMRSTTFDVRAVPKDRLATGYRKNGESFETEPALADGAGGAMGGLFSSARDMARYAAFHLAAWPPRDDPETGPVRRSSVRELDAVARLDGLWVAPATKSKPLRAGAFGYGFGMGVWADCTTQHGLSHGGGLPGYGSIILMLPDQGVAITALANATYAPATVPARRAVALLAQSGALVARKAQAAPALLNAKSAVEEALARREPNALAGSAADNFFLDTPPLRWRTRFDKLSSHGACRGLSIEATNALRGRWHMNCDKGWIDAFVTLAPTSPPKIQFLDLKEGYDPDPRLLRAAEGLLASTDESKLAPGIARELADVSESRGACKLGIVEDGDGRTEATFRVGCARGELRMHVEIDATTGKPKLVRFTPADANRCDDWSRW